MVRRLAILMVLVGCSDPLPPCQTIGDPSLEIAPGNEAFGAFEDGGDLYYGNPPQGGAPYSSFRIRVSGLVDLDKGAMVSMSGEDLDDGADLGFIEYPTNFVCANVGDSAGTWVSSDLHFRFFGWELPDLEDRRMELTIDVVDVDGESQAESLTGELVPY